jgi:2-dehydro-3-deoxy-D-arabinonate dehydratase
MQLAKVRRRDGTLAYGAVRDEMIHYFQGGPPTLGDLLAADEPAPLARQLLDSAREHEPLTAVRLLAPVDRQEIWAAGVTYKRSKIAREEESLGAAQFYDKVYTAARPELFLKATAARVVGPGEPVRIRADSRWSVPEPEWTLVVSPKLKIVGYTIGNDMSARDIEGENPLYLPQAKIYEGSCAVGPVITLAGELPRPAQVEIRLTIDRQGKRVFEGATNLGMMARTPEELVDWLGRENHFPDGVLLLTGTGIVPPDEFTLASGDQIAISIAGIGTLVNRVA